MNRTKKGRTQYKAIMTAPFIVGGISRARIYDSARSKTFHYEQVIILVPAI